VWLMASSAHGFSLGDVVMAFGAHQVEFFAETEPGQDGDLRERRCPFPASRPSAVAAITWNTSTSSVRVAMNGLLVGGACPGCILASFYQSLPTAAPLPKGNRKPSPGHDLPGRNTPPQLPGDQRRKQQDDHAEWQQPAFQHVVVNRQPLPRQADQEPLEEVTPHGRSA